MMPQNIDFRAMYNELPQQVQENVTNFFNCHNIAISIFNQLPMEGQDYVNLCIKMTNHLDEQEPEEHVDRFDAMLNAGDKISS